MMQQWLGLFVKVTQPVLTTLVYTGINSWLDAFQEEIKDRQKEKVKKALDTLNLDQEITNQKEFSVTTKPTKSHLVEEQKISALWPLRLTPQEVQQNSPAHLLRIFLAPPQKNLREFSHLDLDIIDVEQRVSKCLREFLQKNYCSHNPLKATEFLTGSWNNHNFHGESSIRTLFEVLQSLPTIVLHTEIEGSYIAFYLAYWGKNTQKYTYEKIFRFNYQNFLEESVKARVLTWKSVRNQLIALGKSTEDIQRLGDNCELNLRLVEEREMLEAEGIDTDNLTFSYHFNDQDFDYLCQFLNICHCLVTGWVADIHYLINDDIPPHLANWLPALGETFPEISSSSLEKAPSAEVQSQSAIFQATISIYQDILTVLANDSAQDVPELALKLAESLSDLPDPSYAIAQIDYSFNCWCQQRQLSFPETEAIPDQVYSSVSQRDWQYLAQLESCLSNFSQHQQIFPIKKVVEALKVKIPSSRTIPIRGQSSFQLHHSVTTMTEKIFSLTIDPEGNRLISLRQNNTLKLWHLDHQNGHLSPSQELAGHSGKIITVDLCGKGQLLASSDTTEQRSYIKIWHLPTGKLIRTLFGHKQPIHALAINPGVPTFLASGSHKIKLWDFRTGESWLTLFGHREKVCCLAISNDGKTLISGSQDKTIRIWNLTTGQLCQTLRGHRSSVNTVVLSSDGQTLISGSDDKSIKLWDLQTGKLLHTLSGHSGGLRVLTLCSRNQYLVSGCEAGIVNLWEIQTGALQQTLGGHNRPIRTLAFSGDRKVLASGCDAGILKLWKSA